MSMYKKLIGSLTISLLFLLSATPSFAQQNDVKVTGKITDGSGAPLAGVVVVIKDGKATTEPYPIRKVFMKSKFPHPRRFFSPVWAIPTRK